MNKLIASLTIVAFLFTSGPLSSVWATENLRTRAAGDNPESGVAGAMDKELREYPAAQSTGRTPQKTEGSVRSPGSRTDKVTSNSTHRLVSASGADAAAIGNDLMIMALTHLLLHIGWCYGKVVTRYVSQKNEEDGTAYDKDEAYKDIRGADEDLARSLLDEVEKEDLLDGDVDTSNRDSAAGEISDLIIEEEILGRFVPEAIEEGRGSLDIGKLTEVIAKKLKDTFFEFADKITVDKLREILSRSKFQEKIETLVKRVEKYTIPTPKTSQCPTDDSDGATTGGATAGHKTILQQAIRQKPKTFQKGGSVSSAIGTASANLAGDSEQLRQVLQLMQQAGVAPATLTSPGTPNGPGGSEGVRGRFQNQSQTLTYFLS